MNTSDFMMKLSRYLHDEVQFKTDEELTDLGCSIRLAVEIYDLAHTDPVKQPNRWMVCQAILVLGLELEGKMDQADLAFQKLSDFWHARMNEARAGRFYEGDIVSQIEVGW